MELFIAGIEASEIRVIVVFGTRPEAVKMAPVIRALRAEKKSFEVVVCVTAQHREMLDQVLDIFEIEPEVDLNLMKHGQTLPGLTSEVLLKLTEVFQEVRPDVVLVHGDTTTALGASLAAFYARIPVGHVEAGLRTRRLYSPYPEELNCQLISRIARWNFAPTESAKKNLIEEMVDEASIFVTGNTVIDSLHLMLKKIDGEPGLKPEISRELERVVGSNLQDQQFVLITFHRRENLGDGLRQVLEAIRMLAIKFPEKGFVFPVHLNPAIRKMAEREIGHLPNVKLIPPQNYFTFIYLLRECLFVVTDSGGIQEEAPSLGKPVLVMRDHTERPEALHAGGVRLVGTETVKIVESASRLFEDSEWYNEMAGETNLYGSGSAATSISGILKHYARKQAHRSRQET